MGGYPPENKAPSFITHIQKVKTELPPLQAHAREAVFIWIHYKQRATPSDVTRRFLLNRNYFVSILFTMSHSRAICFLRTKIARTSRYSHANGISILHLYASG